MTTPDTAQPAPKIRLCSLVNRAAVKRRALEVAKETRAQGFTRVGASFVDRIEAATRVAIAREVSQHPSKGRTLL